MDSNETCPKCKRELEMMSTTNQWHMYCRACDVRYNDKLEAYSGKDADLLDG
jgi:hypothetical protein